MNKISLFVLFVLFSFNSFGQPASLEGYVFESGNRGFLMNIEITVKQIRNDSIIGTTLSNKEGYFSLPLPLGEKFIIESKHDYFHTKQSEVHTLGSEAGEKVFAKVELNRAPGYLFDITIAETRESEDIVVDAIKKSTIEVYNNTKKEMVLHLVDYLQPDFKVHLKKGNHYTIMIRKEEFITKRMEAFVDVKGCILCFEGVGDVKPGVTDNLTEQNSFGTLLANVELERATMGKEISFLNKIYYERGSAELSEGAKTELEKLKLFLSDNPNLIIELGSHTDSRGDVEKNRQLSFRRAQGAVDYILSGGLIDGSRLLARGYGPSKISNKCGPGVKCTEEEHAVNRRTDLKILGYVKNYVNRSLASMKQEEFMDELLAEIEAEGQVKVPEDGEIPTEMLSNTEVVNAVESEVDEESISVKDAVGSVVSEIEDDISGNTLDTDVSNPLNTQASMNNEISEIPEEELEVSTKVDGVDLYSDTDQTINAQIDETDNEYDPLEWMSGHKVVLVESKTELSGDHAIFEKFKNINVLQSPVSKKYMYIIGGSETQIEAQNYINEELKASYPEAYVISF